MPGYTKLHRRGSKYYFRAKVPVELRESMGRREVKYSLKTSDFKKVRQLIPLESLKIDQLFELDRQKLQATKKLEKETYEVKSLNENQIIRILTQWFLQEEKRFCQWYDNTGMYLKNGEIHQVLQNFGEDAAGYGGTFLQEGEILDLSKEIDAILKDGGLELDQES